MMLFKLKKSMPYTEKSISNKLNILKFLISLSKSILIFPTLIFVGTYLNNNIHLPIQINNIKILFQFTLFLLITYINYKRIKYLNYSTKWEFLDDKLFILNKVNSESEQVDINISKFIILIFSNLAIIVPFLFLFSLIIGSIVKSVTLILIGRFIDANLSVFLGYAIQYIFIILILPYTVKEINTIFLIKLEKE